ncbi:MAG: thermopsin family protease [Nitrososphaerales archaeon]
MPSWLFNGAYADYAFQESGSYPRYQYTLSNVNNRTGSADVTIQRLDPGYEFPNAAFSGIPYEFPLLVNPFNPFELSQLNQGEIPQYSLPFATVTPNTVITVPAGTFTTDAVTFTHDMSYPNPVATSPSTIVYYDMNSGLIVEATQVADLTFFRTLVTLQLQDTDIPMTSAAIISRTPPLASTATSISCTPQTVPASKTTTCTAIVEGGLSPTGSVDFTSSSGTGTFTPQNGQCQLSSGACSVSYTDSTSGTPTITASYQGDFANAPSADTATVSVTSATSGSLLVTVTDSLSNDALPGVSVEVENSADDIVASGMTDSAGQLSLQGIPSGTYTLLAYGPTLDLGVYNSYTGTVNVQAGILESQAFSLVATTVTTLQGVLENEANVPMSTGIASYGVYDYDYGLPAYQGRFTPDVITSDEFMGYASVTSLDSGCLVLVCSTLQLNAFLHVSTTSGDQFFWLQNVAEFAPLGYTYLDNVWNYTTGASTGINSNYISGNGLGLQGNGGIGTLSNGENYYYDHDTTNSYSDSAPFRVYSLVQESNSNDNVIVYFSYVSPITQQIVTYDTVTITAKASILGATLLATPYAQAGGVVDAEFVWGGAPGGNNVAFDSLVSDLGLFYMSNGVFQAFPSIFSFGYRTQETSSNLQVSITPPDSYAAVSIPSSGTPDNSFLTNDFGPIPSYSAPVAVSDGSASLDATPVTGVSVSVSGSSATQGPATISTEDLSGQPSGTGVLDLANAGYYDVQITGMSGGTAQVCISNPSVAANTVMKYYTSGGWVDAANPSVDLLVSPGQVCGGIPVSALTGTPVVIGTSASTTVTNSSTTSEGGGIPEFPYQLGLVSLVTLAVVVSYVATRRRACVA